MILTLFDAPPGCQYVVGHQPLCPLPVNSLNGSTPTACWVLVSGSGAPSCSSSMASLFAVNSHLWQACSPPHLLMIAVPSSSSCCFSLSTLLCSSHWTSAGLTVCRSLPRMSAILPPAILPAPCCSVLALPVAGLSICHFYFWFSCMPPLLIEHSCAIGVSEHFCFG